MSRSFSKWNVTTRPGDGGSEPGDPRGPVVEIDGGAWLVHVTVEDDGRGRPYLTTLALHLDGRRGQITRNQLAAVPVDTITEVAAGVADQYWTERKAGKNEQQAASQAVFITDFGSDPAPRRRGPSSEEFAKQWRATAIKDHPTPQGLLPRRDALASHYGVHVQTIDTWTRRARDLGLIPPASTGRLRKSETPPKRSGRGSATNTKGTKK